MVRDQMDVDIHTHVSCIQANDRFPADDVSVSLKAVDSQTAPAADAKVESWYSCMQALWQETTCKELKVPYKYESVAALVVHWEGDSACEKESRELHSLFANDFNYKSRILSLSCENEPKRQLRHGLDSLVLKHDGPCRSNLLIVYYSGHGVATHGPGLIITGESDHDPAATWQGSAYPPQANWNEIEEEALRNTRADILSIIDCCSAGSIWKDGTHEERSWQVLAASRATCPTAGAGDKSFTRALIDCLKARLKSQPDELFTVNQLHDDIVKNRDDDRSVCRPRNRVNKRYIKLAPVDGADKIGVTPASHTKESASLTLRVSFRDKVDLTEEEVTKMARHIARGASNARLSISKIDWVEFQQHNPAPTTDFQRLCFGVIIVQRLWRRRKAQNNGKRMRHEDFDERERPQSPKRPRAGSRFASTQLQVDAFGHISPSPSNKSGRETPDLTL
ncbi:hypothetical protein AC578_4605 [Pseudocercospora eumusae]|uniref:Uncharacterized protein n=1 Tax=Pseudocercospora eumusae TaxID=321146 RepID=A0A139H4Y3_9PEZI|nr:hypothetical protein AC578_4605 [Pseudocercospora eumusae]